MGRAAEKWRAFFAETGDNERGQGMMGNIRYGPWAMAMAGHASGLVSDGMLHVVVFRYVGSKEGQGRVFQRRCPGPSVGGCDLGVWLPFGWRRSVDCPVGELGR